MKRKDFIKKGLVAATAGTALLTGCKTEEVAETGAPNIITNKKYKWRMVTTWPPNFPVLGESANLLSEYVNKMSGGRLEIKVYGGGELVPPFEAFDAVAQGIAEMGCGAGYYWVGKAPAAVFFAAVPFGMNAQQLTAWLVSGGGLELWKEVYEKFNLVPFLGGNSGVQMGGWFNKEINTIDDFKGLKMRIPGLGGKVIEKAGGAAMTVAGGEIYTNLERGVIDATEWVGPYHDYKMGFPKVAKYYYNPGWHEVGTQLEFFANKPAYEKLPLDLQEIILSASMRIQTWMLAEFDVQNAIFLQKIISEGKNEIRQFPKPVLDQLKIYTEEAIQELIGADPMANKVYKSYRAFQTKAAAWSEVTEQAYYEKVMK